MAWRTATSSTKVAASSSTRAPPCAARSSAKRTPVRSLPPRKSWRPLRPHPSRCRLPRRSLRRPRLPSSRLDGRLERGLFEEHLLRLLFAHGEQLQVWDQVAHDPVLGIPQVLFVGGAADAEAARDVFRRDFPRRRVVAVPA